MHQPPPQRLAGTGQHRRSWSTLGSCAAWRPERVADLLIKKMINCLDCGFCVVECFRVDTSITRCREGGVLGGVAGIRRGMTAGEPAEKFFSPQLDMPVSRWYYERGFIMQD